MTDKVYVEIVPTVLSRDEVYEAIVHELLLEPGVEPGCEGAIALSLCDALSVVDVSDARNERDLLIEFLEWYDPEARSSDRSPRAVDDFLRENHG